jgi:hypothetical protein
VNSDPLRPERVFNGGMRRVMLLLTVMAGTAAADKPAKPSKPAKPRSSTPTASAPTSSTAATAPATTPVTSAQPLSLTPSAQPYLVFDPPPPPVKSLRLEALRIAGERAESDWRFPTPEPIFGYQEGGWFMGYGAYRPRTRRSAALHGGSMAATLLGEILINTGSPLAGVGALATGATLDAAAADVDRDAEAKRPR